MVGKKTLKERRAESDSKIISASIRCFTENGYTNTTLIDIAKEAGVTGGLISQRYGTKENLLKTVINMTISTYFSDVEEDCSPRQCFFRIYDQIRFISENDEAAFNFCVMMNRSMDIPKVVLDDYKNHMAGEYNVVRILSEAQREGTVPEGKLDLLLFSFSSYIFYYISLCKKFDTEIPDCDFFLSIINISDEEAHKQRIKIKEQIIDIFCKEFQAVWLIKLDDLTMDIYSSDLENSIHNSVSTALKINSYDDARKWYVENYVIDQSKEKVLEMSKIEMVLDGLKGGRGYHIEYGRLKDGTVNYNQLFYDRIINPENKETEYLLLGFRDIDITKKTEIDDLTGLLLRHVFFQKAEILMAENPDEQFDIVLSDIVDFKKINEIYGADVADEILKWHGRYLTSLKDDKILIGRYGGDQMVMIGPHDHITKYHSEEFRKKFIEAERNNDLPSIKIKYGIYPNVRHGSSILAVCDKAHMALNSIKYHYSKEIAVYDETIKMQLEKQRKIEESMHDSLKNGDFKVFYQPKHNANTDELVGAEALIRWIHPKYGFMSPADFIPLFEQNGFVSEIDSYVMHRTCENIRRWTDKGIKTVPISINASRLTLKRDDLIEDVRETIKRFDLKPGQLHLEITETLMTDNTEELVAKLNSLRELGCKVELDDFGSGYSSLNILSTFPIDVLKLDMSFLQQFGDEKRAIVLKSCIDMAKKLGFETVSEGVELEGQKEVLGELGVDMIQGYYFSKPLSESDFEQYMIEHS